MCKGLESWWNLQAMNIVQNGQARTSLHLVKQGATERAARIKNGQTSHLKTILEVARCVTRK